MFSGVSPTRQLPDSEKQVWEHLELVSEAADAGLGAPALAPGRGVQRPLVDLGGSAAFVTERQNHLENLSRTQVARALLGL